MRGTGVGLVVAFCVLALALALEEGRLDVTPIAKERQDGLEAALARNRAVATRRHHSAAGSNPGPSGPEQAVEAAGDFVEPRESFTNFRQVRGVAAPRPPATPRLGWLEPMQAAERVEEAVAAAGREWVFGWIQYGSGLRTEGLRGEWESLGVDVLGIGAKYARVRLPGSKEAIEALARHPAVVGLGVRPGAEKIAPGLKLETAQGGREVPVVITLMDGDADGGWRNDLEARGVVVGDWLPEVRAYAANVRLDVMSEVADADFVSGIEPVKIARALLDTAVPVLGADSLRKYDAATGSFTGRTGSSVAVGIADTGLNIAHNDIRTGRRSVCGTNTVADDGELDLWSDYEGHGTHVTGIIAGSGSAASEFAGVAPAVSDLRVAKVLNRESTGDTISVLNGVRYLLRETSCEWQGEQSDAVRPAIVNLSVGGEGPRDGRSVKSRSADAIVWRGSQVFVLAAGNSGSAGTSDLATSKNSLTIGAITDAGVVTSFSSHGPSADGRLVPHVVGTGSAVISAKGNGSATAYRRASGTSMAAPAVSGVAALLLDGDGDFRNRPAYVKARLMASAVKPGAVLGTEAFPLTNAAGPGPFNHEYGLGLVSATVAAADGTGGTWWHGGDHGSVAAGESYEYDIEVPEDTARLDVVLTWTEPPSESIAATAVAADLDLYLDEDGDCEASACGEHASTSRIDNVEWIILQSPEPGMHKVRIVAANDFVDPVRAGIAWTAISDSDAPVLSVSTDDPQIDIGSGDAFEIEVDVDSDRYVAAGTTLHLACRSDDGSLCEGYTDAGWRPGSKVARADGTQAEVRAPATAVVALGEIRGGETKRLRLVAPRDVATSSHTLYFVASSWNAVSGVQAVDVLVGGRESGPRVARPANDAVEKAAMLEGLSGEMDIDLLLATREPGEPMMREDRGSSGKKFFEDSPADQDGYDEEMQAYARHGSLWYSIEADQDGPFRLAVLPSWNASNTWVSVYEGTVASDATRMAESSQSVEFVAERGEKYLVQVWSNEAIRMPLRFAWNQFEDERPGNDDFEDRAEITGLRGTVDGTNYRATLEGFEFYGARNAGVSTWYKWKAPESGRFGLSFPGSFDAFVFSGTEVSSLRRVSTMPKSYGRTEFMARQGKEYQVVVIDSGEDVIPDYELSWHPVEGSSYGYAANDMSADAAVIEGSSGEVSVSTHANRRTVEPDEDQRTGVGTNWWRWDPPEAGSHVFRLDDGRSEKIAMFVGESADDLDFVAEGNPVVVDARAGSRYWLSVGFRTEAMFADLEGARGSGGFSWGPLPANDTPAEAMALSGSSGSASADHTWATNSTDEPGGIRGHSSLWWSWEARSAGWQRFELEDWEESGLDEPTQQSILAVYRRTRQGELEEIATSDHSYVASGRAEATIRASLGGRYLVRVALRDTDLGDWSRETTFSWEPVEAPAWQRHGGRLAEISEYADDAVDAELILPKGIAVEGETGLVVVATRENLAGYARNGNGKLARRATVPYQTQTGAAIEVLDDVVLHWDSNASVLYLVQRDGIFAVRGLDRGSRHLERCQTSDSDGVVPSQVVTDPEGENLYLVGDGRIEVYARKASCEFDLLQVLNSGYGHQGGVRVRALAGASSLAARPSGDRVFVSSDEGLLVFEREDGGTLSLESTVRTWRWMRTSYSWHWESASLVRAGEDMLFYVSGTSPMVAAFRLGESSDAEAVEVLGVLEGFFLEEDDYYRSTFYSHMAWPSSSRGCSAATAQGTADQPAVDVICEGQVVTVGWDGTGEELYVADWFAEDQADRFGGSMRRGLRSVAPSLIAEAVDGERNYVIGEQEVGTIHVFDRASAVEADPYLD